MRDDNQDTIVNLKVDDTQGPKTRHKDACLVVIYGQDLGRKYNLVGRELRIGRATTNDICLSQDAVSREHAHVIVDDFGIKIRDNDSTNGTYINDNKIHEAYLRDGDLVKIGRAIFKFLSGDNIESSYHEEIFRLSTVDGLTQVFNRRYFMETIERELSRARRYDRPLALLIFDIDHFKRCNDTYGHRAGDYVLRRMAELVTARARKVDVVARYGGEEFAVILPEIDIRGAETFAEKVRGLVEAETFAFEGRKIPVTISIGVAELDSAVANADDLIQTADRRLYAAKTGGRNRVVAKD
ncbi:diguanylate cyclase [Pseudenhygromyxa sp. WMMC2535]|uniref:GGDEF domain-containing protein n=1 Tax=Pseudenhygromyxa sp. WMMC2535 TaxID=2712867 RepID=UPI001552B0FB|nr:GGDEF domain-containing protein [Pseudenhygromyxa sp. WMMC2535]NVB41241.1 diguanylate cyclase [Pseudenhygromyxa sp. WMMC2535]